MSHEEWPAITTTVADPAAIAGGLGKDEIHIWKLVYDPATRRAPLLALLAAYMGVEVGDVTLIEGEHGRPALAAGHGSSVDFNWSHSGDRAVAAMGHGVSLGIDIEHVRARPRALEIAERYFSHTEFAALKSVPPEQRSAAFLDIWTAKEAVLKALGRGIAFGLHRLDISVDDGQPRLRRLEGEDVADWNLQRIPVEIGSVTTLAWRGAMRRCRIFSLANAG